MRRLTAFCFAVLFSSSAAAAGLRWTPETAARLEAAIAEGAYQTVTSVLVREHGDAVYEGYFNGADAGTLHNTRSATKTINSMLIGAAIADGDLEGVEQGAFSFFRDKRPFANPDKRKAAITVEDLMTMSSPLECDDWNQFSRGNEERMYLIEDMGKFFLDLPMRGYPVWSPPPDKRPYGRAFSYCTAGANLVGQIAARAAGEDLEAYAQRRLFTPLGVASVKWPRTGTGDVMAGGGLELTTQTLARLGELYLNKGEWNGAQILPASWIEESLKPRAEVEEGVEYGYLWWLMEYEAGEETHPVAFMSGNGGNRVFILPDHDIVVVITKTDYNTKGMHEAAQALFDDFIVQNISAGD